ncbi:hypothetical protein HHO41_19395 [Bacillus sp. DNRA2]|uniref:hypothetical protein n=1 Tax=Bacillus sp. DNRA2 TaxID=2723053 RepID=UPI00145DF0D8|nr:hypothetical protein [Bacillus sp. DNRA2]NMD72439.1 hypothetical protein [Bacillus sp. DNRA2]
MTTFKGLETERIVFEDGTFEDYIKKSDLVGKTIIDNDVLKRKQEYYDNKKNYELFTDVVGGVTFMLVDTLKAFHQDVRFNDMEKARIMFLGTYVSYDDKGSYLMTNNNRYLLKKDLRGLLEISNEKEFYKFYKKMIETEILEEELLGRFEIRLKWNSKYHFKGKASKGGTGGTETVKAYDRQIQALYKEKDANGKSVNTPKNLYLLFMVLPFINVESGVLCHQQQNPVEDGCQPIELNELAKMLNYTKASTLKNKLLGCKLYGTNVFFIGEGMKNRKKYTRIFVNPYVAGRSGKMPNATLKAMFPETEKAIVQKLQEKRKK